MNFIEETVFNDEQPSLHYHSYISSLIPPNETLSLTLDPMLDISLSINHTSAYSNETNLFIDPNFELTSLSYKIISGLVCAFLCFLTITGNFLVLITFRRMRTVSEFRTTWSLDWLSQPRKPFPDRFSLFDFRTLTINLLYRWNTLGHLSLHHLEKDWKNDFPLRRRRIFRT